MSFLLLTQYVGGRGNVGSLVGMNEQKRDVCRALRECLTPRFALTNKVKAPLFSHLLHNPLMSEPLF